MVIDEPARVRPFKEMSEKEKLFFFFRMTQKGKDLQKQILPLAGITNQGK